MDSNVQLLYDELKTGLKEIYQERLHKVLIYGSYARGDEDLESDLDVLIVLDDIPYYGAEIQRTSALISELSLRYGVPISRIFMSYSDWLNLDSPLLRNIRVDAITA